VRKKEKRRRYLFDICKGEFVAVTNDWNNQSFRGSNSHTDVNIVSVNNLVPVQHCLSEMGI